MEVGSGGPPKNTGAQLLGFFQPEVFASWLNGEISGVFFETTDKVWVSDSGSTYGGSGLHCFRRPPSMPDAWEPCDPFAPWFPPLTWSQGSQNVDPIRQLDVCAVNTLFLEHTFLFYLFSRRAVSFWIPCMATSRA
jgi:hypothetical protein